MRRPVLITLVVLLVAGVGGVFFKFWKDYTNVKASEEKARIRYAQTIDVLAEIQDSLNTIALGDTMVKMLSQNLETEKNLSQPSNETLDRIAELRGSIMRSKERINRLETDLKKSGIRVSGLQKLIANLRRSVVEKETLISQLTGTVDSLTTQVSSLAEEVAQVREGIREREATIEERRRELATVYYIAAPKRDLSASGIVVAKGGFLGLGRTLQPSGHINESLFTALDTDQHTVIQMPTTRARVLSPQPTSSYELKLVDGKMELHILQPREFRKVRQLIILTA